MSGPGCRGSLQGDYRPRIIEILGAPGAGKSSLASAMDAGGDDVRWVHTYCSRSNLLPWVRSGAWLLPLMLTGSFSDPLPLKQRVWAVRISASHAILTRASAGRRLLLLDQGPLFTMLRLMELTDAPAQSPRWRRWWRKELSAWANTIDLAVVLDAPNDVLLKRVRARAKPHALKDISGPDARKALARWRDLLEDLIGDLQTHGDVEVLRMDTGSSSIVEVAAGTMRVLRLEVPPREGKS
jgi:hypothetical protein